MQYFYGSAVSRMPFTLKPHTRTRLTYMAPAKHDLLGAISLRDSSFRGGRACCAFVQYPFRGDQVDRTTGLIHLRLDDVLVMRGCEGLALPDALWSSGVWNRSPRTATLVDSPDSLSMPFRACDESSARYERQHAFIRITPRGLRCSVRSSAK